MEDVDTGLDWKMILKWVLKMRCEGVEKWFRM
jgi:hypothetical protein